MARPPERRRATSSALVLALVDFGEFRPERPFQDLVLKKLRPGDIYTHAFYVPVPMLDDQGRLLPYLFEARKRGVLFDVKALKGRNLNRGEEITVQDLKDALARQKMTETDFRVGDVGLVRCGWGDLWMVDNKKYYDGEPGVAIDACQWLIDEMKRVVPIWKRPVP